MRSGATPKLHHVDGHDPREADRAFRWLTAAENLPEWQAMAEVAAEQGSRVVNDIVDRAVAAGRWC